MPLIPDEFNATILRLRGSSAREWLDSLPATLAVYTRRWLLTLGEPFAALSFNYVTRATRADGTPAVLKIGFADDKEFSTEAKALDLYDGRGMVTLLDADLTDAVLLMERVEPGAPLTTIEDDDQAMRIAANVMRRYWRPAPPHHSFPTVARWGLGFERHRQRFGGSGPIPSALFEQAAALYSDLQASMAEPALLHGDLHHDNILSATRESCGLLSIRKVLWASLHTKPARSCAIHASNCAPYPMRNRCSPEGSSCSPTRLTLTASECAVGESRRQRSPPSGALKTAMTSAERRSASAARSHWQRSNHRAKE